jgi:hypothetical protein
VITDSGALTPSFQYIEKLRRAEERAHHTKKETVRAPLRVRACARACTLVRACVSASCVCARMLFRSLTTRDSPRTPQPADTERRPKFERAILVEGYAAPPPYPPPRALERWPCR